MNNKDRRLSEFEFVQLAVSGLEEALKVALNMKFDGELKNISSAFNNLIDKDDYLYLAAKKEYEERARRNYLIDSDLFGEPAWDILLDLYVSFYEKKRISVTSSCLASRVPPSTALRWLGILEKRGLIVRTSDPSDKRRAWVQLTERGISVMNRLLSERIGK